MGNILDMRRTMGSQELPVGVVPIEYLMSSGTQLINTGILVGEYPFKVEFRAMIISMNGTENDFFGNYHGAKNTERKCVVCGRYANTFHVWTGSRWQPQQIEPWQWYDISLSLPNKQVADMAIIGNEYHKEIVSDITESPSTICLFCDGEHQLSNLIGMLASFKMTIKNSIVLDLIPVRVGEIGYMYDKVSGQLFGNAGTGDFFLGPDKVGGGKCLIINMLRGYSAERRVA